MSLSNRILKLSTSSTIVISNKAKKLRANGHDVINLGFGEPDFNTPEQIINATIEAMNKGFTKYTPSDGIIELKKEIIKKYKNEQNLEYKMDEVIVSTGAKFALYLAFQAILNEGDEVVIPTPYWVSYPDQVKLAGGVPVFVECEEDNEFKLTVEQLKEVCTHNTKAIILNSPNNPSGSIYNREDIIDLANYCVENNILIIYDEIYEKLIYTDDEHICISSLSNDIKNNTILINGVSKSHAMTGWRIGYAVGPKKYISAMASLASHTTSNPTSIAQYGALAALKLKEETLSSMKETFALRLDAFYDELVKIRGIKCIKPKGAFYIFINMKEIAKVNGFKTVDEWASTLLEEEKVAVVPGSGFGAPDYIRLSYASSTEDLIEAVNRIERFIRIRRKNK